MKTAIREAIRGGLPSLAECGGFLYLHKSLKDMEGRQYSMAGVIDADADYRGKLVRFGYVELTEKESCFLPEKKESGDTNSIILTVRKMERTAWQKTDRKQKVEMCLGRRKPLVGISSSLLSVQPFFCGAFLSAGRIVSTIEIEAKDNLK